jgi:hypothetical protein
MNKKLTVGGVVVYISANIQTSVYNCYFTCANDATCLFFSYYCSTSMCLLYEPNDIINGIYYTDLPKAQLQLVSATGYISGILYASSGWNCT